MYQTLQICSFISFENYSNEDCHFYLKNGEDINQCCDGEIGFSIVSAFKYSRRHDIEDCLV